MHSGFFPGNRILVVDTLLTRGVKKFFELLIQFLGRFLVFRLNSRNEFLVCGSDRASGSPVPLSSNFALIMALFCR